MRFAIVALSHQDDPERVDVDDLADLVAHAQALARQTMPAHARSPLYSSVSTSACPGPREDRVKGRGAFLKMA